MNGLNTPAIGTPPAPPSPVPSPAPGPGHGGGDGLERGRPGHGGPHRDGTRRAPSAPARRTALLDAALWAILALPVMIGMMTPQPQDLGWWAQGAGLAALAAAIVLGRTRPLIMLPVVVTLILVHPNFVFGMPVAAYLTGRRLDRARPLLWTFTAIFVAGTAINIVRGIDVTTWFPLTIYLVLLGVLPWLVGRYWRQYQELLHAGWERAERLEREQRIVTERERLRERARIAQDMHDSLGHELALIAVRAGALQVAPGLAEQHRAAAAQLRAGAAEATEHLREIIGVLRESGPGGPAPAAAAHPSAGTSLDDPGLHDAALTRPARESIAELVERARASGIPVRLAAPAVTGAGGGAGGEADVLPETTAMVALAAHRVVQEALTNAAKHAPGAPVTVHLAHTTDTPGGIAVSVINQAPPDGPPLLPPATSNGGGTGGGHGLAGLAERVRLAGGTLHTGPTPEGGFEVAARLPATPPATTAASDATPPAARHDAHTHGAPEPGGDEQAAMSESARRLARERRQVRRELVTAIAVPAALVAVLSGIMVGYYVYATLNSVLRPAQYAALQTGTPQDKVEPALPRMQTLDTGARRAQYPEPGGALCRYYRSSANVLGVGDIYRLCFTSGRLASKEVLRAPAPAQPGDGGPQDDHAPTGETGPGGAGQ
ncbi:sensor histidine kinase [Actinomadura rugatobispora]|uniref:histidine kinase n=1 Tax=Actinomadura rugatobispora TaxID=1994 RepID=A0ABW1A386_9ACTN